MPCSAYYSSQPKSQLPVNHNAHVFICKKTGVVSVNLQANQSESLPAPYALESPKLHVKTSLFRASIVCCHHDATCICCSVLAPAEHHLQHGCGCPSISPTCMVLSSKPASCCCCCRSMGHTDRRTPDRYIYPAPYTMSATSAT